MKILAVIFLASICSSSFAFNWKRCQRTFPNENPTSLGFAVFQKLVGGITSTFEYVSSTGHCAAFGSLEVQKDFYYTLNYNHIQNETARGNGETLEGLFVLFGCSDKQRPQVLQDLKQNFELYFDVRELQLSKERVFQKLAQNCHSQAT